MRLCDDIGEVQLQMDGTKEKIIEIIRRKKIMDMCYDGTLVMPSSYAVMDEDEMSYVEGGSAKEWAVGICCSLIANALWAIGLYVKKNGVKAALYACAGAAKAVWAGITSAASFIWNSPVALAILAGTVGIGVGIVIGYYGLRKKK